MIEEAFLTDIASVMINAIKRHPDAFIVGYIDGKYMEDIDPVVTDNKDWVVAYHLGYTYGCVDVSATSQA